MLEQLNRWHGVTHVFSLVDRHESNGAERVIQEVVRHISAMVNEARVVKKWSDPGCLMCMRLSHVW